MVVGNVYDKSTGERLLATAIEKFGSADVLVNNAGIFETRPFLEVDEAYLDRFLNTNLKGTYFTTQAIIPQMLKQHDGVVINIGTPLVNHGLAEYPLPRKWHQKVQYMRLPYNWQPSLVKITSG
jgi:NAD(P)-dependent dehydrogenase (short-subunit alcohol dehydrogenase family)